jgi:hypothetical protein
MALLKKGGHPVTQDINRVGYGCGIVACFFAVAYGLVQCLQIVGVLRFPVDDVLIYGTSLCIVVPFMLEMLAFHHLTLPDKQFWTHAALMFTILYAVFVTANYVVQLATVIPAQLGGVSEPIDLLTQTPHSLFWDYDAIGYIAMGLAALLAIPAVSGDGFERWVRLSLIAHAVVTPFIGTVYFYPTFSARLLLLGFPWAVTAPLMMGMVAVMLRKRGNAVEQAVQRTHQ